ncbi:hypothetical protein CLAFUW4_03448 [Fulvia fulva]|uniref:Uncharacterized protein n=1 Tax=Passalora fulva TaxID=5499 RepID=A0A9Q8P611_PASFU|nr:uncharacterized protein CLAFUR5_03427 [Fulvia fulva]KAK4631801.1 hypothetical protein CLAFUR4_03437 [Fulvia fulva]KAK4633713.1 hypothetical protein CLAFUR0_03442 [Fulvia fulva]UJO14563.1 hypothetical protein CLAFUR5_03427 [Fulvia fulva]WPV11475.1 hypothetical protein CLAFUW4_03448 [Fulvia fulva]WPV26642.1 hypothetical protein CLAFUW7_03440 [Fulvia fulva]
MSSSRLLQPPAELRNSIYQLCVAQRQTDPVDLRHATPPSKAFLLTCRQIHEEAQGLYRSAYRNYWRTLRFIIECGHNTHAKLDKTLISRIPTIDLEHIQHLTITQECGGEDSEHRHVAFSATLLARTNVWRIDATVTLPMLGSLTNTAHGIFDYTKKGRKFFRKVEMKGEGTSEQEVGASKFAMKEQIFCMLRKLDAAARPVRGLG